MTFESDTFYSLQRGGAAHNSDIDSFSLHLAVRTSGLGRDTLNCRVDCKIWCLGCTGMLVFRGRNEDLDLMCLMRTEGFESRYSEWFCIACVAGEEWQLICPARLDNGNTKV